MQYSESGIAELMGLLVLLVIGMPFCIATPYALGYLLGLEYEAELVKHWILALDTWLRILCLAGVGLVGFFILLIVCIIIYQAGKRLLIALLAFTEWVIAATLRTVEAMLELISSILKGLIWFLLQPFRLIGEFVADKFIAARTSIGQWKAEQQALRALYRDEYSDDFSSFRAFKRYWSALQRGEEPPYPGKEEKAKAEPKPKPKADLYSLALKELGLSEPFTEAAFKARYRRRMKEVHPDITGSNGAATRLNAAIELIKKRKGWS
jgi:hypothetical protein